MPFLPATHASLSSCRYCGTALNPLEMRNEGVCSHTACQQQRMAEKRKAFRETRQKFKAQMTARAQAMARAETRAIPEQVVSLAYVPANTRNLVPLPAQRKQAFIEFLTGLLARHAECTDLPREELPREIPVPDPVDPPPSPAQHELLALSCAVCRGHCCRQGTTHAFQDLPSQRRIHETFPQFSDSQLLIAYANYLPAISYEDSCVFHTETGCSLPRDMRSDMCNQWMCEGQHRWLEELPGEGGVLVYVVATPSYQPHAVRAALVHPTLAAHGGLGLRPDSAVGENPPADHHGQ